VSPVKTTVSCDICGRESVNLESTRVYPSFFELLNITEGLMTGIPEGQPGHGSGMAMAAPRKLKVSMRSNGSLRLCLCREHFKSLMAACEAWFAGVAPPELIPTEDEIPTYYRDRP
jgi:hypothetical protein